MKILLLSPQIDAGHKIAKGLQAKGNALLISANPTEAVQMLKLHGHSVDLAIVHREGVGGKGDPGIQFIARIKSDREYSDLPILLTTDAWGDADCVKHQKSAHGVNAYLRAPLSEARMIEVIQGIFGQAPAAPPASPAPGEFVLEDATRYYTQQEPSLSQSAIQLEAPELDAGEETRMAASRAPAAPQGMPRIPESAVPGAPPPPSSQDLSMPPLPQGSSQNSLVAPPPPPEPSLGTSPEPSIEMPPPLPVELPPSSGSAQEVGMPPLPATPVEISESALNIPSGLSQQEIPPPLPEDSLPGMQGTGTFALVAAQAEGTPLSTENIEDILDRPAAVGAAPEFEGSISPSAYGDAYGEPPSGSPSGGSKTPAAPSFDSSLLSPASLEGGSQASGELVFTPPGVQPEGVDPEAAQEMPYLFEKKPAVDPAFLFAEPVGDAVVPGGAAQSPDIETFKKYLLLREQDVAVLSTRLKSSQEQVAMVEQILREERAKTSEMSHVVNEQKQKIDDFEKEKMNLVNRFEGEIRELNFQVKAKVDKARLFETQVKESSEEVEHLKERVRTDIRKIRVREKELENRLEIMKKDTEALLTARENKIIELKRKLDLLEFNMDLLQDQHQREKEKSSILRERLSKAAQIVRVAGGLLDTQKDPAKSPSTSDDPSTASEGSEGPPPAPAAPRTKGAL